LAPIVYLAILMTIGIPGNLAVFQGHYQMWRIHDEESDGCHNQLADPEFGECVISDKSSYIEWYS
jgi:hypothetical protein